MGGATSQPEDYNDFMRQTRWGLDVQLMEISEMYEKSSDDPEQLIRDIKERIKDRPELAEYRNNIDALYSADLAAYREFGQLFAKYASNPDERYFPGMAANLPGIYRKYAQALAYYIKSTDVAMVVVPSILIKLNAIIELVAQVAVGISSYIAHIDAALGDVQARMKNADRQTLRQMQQASQEIKEQVDRIISTFSDSVAELHRSTQLMQRGKRP